MLIRHIWVNDIKELFPVMIALLEIKFFMNIIMQVTFIIQVTSSKLTP